MNSKETAHRAKQTLESLKCERSFFEQFYAPFFPKEDRRQVLKLWYRLEMKLRSMAEVD